MLTDGRRMKIEKIRCEVCDTHCEREAKTEDGEVTDVSGNGCMKGYIFAQQEIRRIEEG